MMMMMMMMTVMVMVTVKREMMDGIMNDMKGKKNLR